MSNRQNFKPLAIAVGAALATSLGAAANADSSPFAMTTLASGYMAADIGEGKCGGDKGEEGTCGGDKDAEGHCGEDKDAEGHCGGDKGEEGKCGEGKCGGSV